MGVTGIAQLTLEGFDHQEPFLLHNDVAHPQMHGFIGPFGGHGGRNGEHVTENGRAGIKPVHRVRSHKDQVVGAITTCEPRDGNPALPLGDKSRRGVAWLRMASVRQRPPLVLCPMGAIPRAVCCCSVASCICQAFGWMIQTVARDVPINNAKCAQPMRLLWTNLWMKHPVSPSFCVWTGTKCAVVWRIGVMRSRRGTLPLLV